MSQHSLKASSLAVIPKPATASAKPHGKAVMRPPSAGRGPTKIVDQLLFALVDVFSSLKLTIVCLILGLVLVFAGTLAQVDMGLYKAQNEFFRSLFIKWGPAGASWKIPVFPGGYLVGSVLLLNLVTAHFRRFKFTRKKAGIWMIHVGLILLLLGQLLTDIFSQESVMHIREGDTKNYSETERRAELAVIDATDPNTDTVVAIPEGLLASRREIQHPQLPFTVRIRDYFPNSVAENRAPESLEPPAASRDIGARAVVRESPKVTDMDHRDVPSAVIELMTPKGSIGTWLVSEYIEQPQTFTNEGHTYQLALRPQRHYKPFSLKLLEFKHDIYPGTDIPKNFSSRVVLDRPTTGENREVPIYMNNPLRYNGETYYQASFDKDDHGTVLQVVRNPSWLAPYFACILVGLGLIVQFGMGLFGFAFKRRKA